MKTIFIRVLVCLLIVLGAFAVAQCTDDMREAMRSRNLSEQDIVEICENSVKSPTFNNNSFSGTVWKYESREGGVGFSQTISFNSDGTVYFHQKFSVEGYSAPTGDWSGTGSTVNGQGICEVSGEDAVCEITFNGSSTSGNSSQRVDIKKYRIVGNELYSVDKNGNLLLDDFVLTLVR